MGTAITNLTIRIGCVLFSFYEGEVTSTPRVEMMMCEIRVAIVVTPKANVSTQTTMQDTLELEVTVFG